MHILWPMKILMRTALTTIAVLSALACGGSGGTGPGGPSGSAVDHIVMSTSAASVSVGKTIVLSATPVASDGSNVGTGITWSSGTKAVSYTHLTLPTICSV